MRGVSLEEKPWMTEDLFRVCSRNFLPFQEHVPIAAPDRYGRSAVHQHAVSAMEERLDFADGVEVDDSRAVDAGERPRIEAGGQGADRLPNEVSLLPNMEADV